MSRALAPGSSAAKASEKSAEPAPFVRPEIAVAADPPGETELLRAAARLAVDLNLPFLEKPKTKDHDMMLVVTPGRLELRVLKGEKDLKGGRPLYADFDSLDTTSAQGRSLSQPIAKAVGIKKRSDLPPTVIDATAGWGEDTWLLASLGCRVLTVERNRVVQTLLRDAVLRAGAAHPEMLPRIHIVGSDARHLLRRLDRLHHADHVTAEQDNRLEDLPAAMQGFLEPDVVFLDPMFPGGRKTAERKPMKVLRKLVGGDEDAAELLDMALRVAKQRVVVKRPIKAEPLGELKPTTTHKGKSLRYDVYVTKK